MLLAAIITAHHSWRPSAGELWFGTLGLLAGLIAGVHMSQPKYMRR